jgi:hypothetical protein
MTGGRFGFFGRTRHMRELLGVGKRFILARFCGLCFNGGDLGCDFCYSRFDISQLLSTVFNLLNQRSVLSTRYLGRHARRCCGCRYSGAGTNFCSNNSTDWAANGEPNGSAGFGAGKSPFCFDYLYVLGKGAGAKLRG